jgi:hypothetical protein
MFQAQSGGRKMDATQTQQGFAEIVFRTRSGGLPRISPSILEAITPAITRREDIPGYHTVANGQSGAGRLGIIAREVEGIRSFDTREPDGDRGQTIYETIEGVRFVWMYSPGCAHYFDSGAIVPPSGKWREVRPTV